VDATPTLKGGSGLGIPSAPAIVFPSGLIGTPHIKDAERLQGFPPNWTKPVENVGRQSERWRLVGNAVNVRSAEWIGRRLANPRKVLEFETLPMRKPGPWPLSAWNIGDGRYAVKASEWPVARKYLGLEEFLRFAPTPLSPKATKGFLKRAENSGLRLDPKLLPALRTHVWQLEKNGKAPA
jgi:DNA (cytosine-5)-methyltransferase 1